MHPPGAALGCGRRRGESEPHSGYALSYAPRMGGLILDVLTGYAYQKKLFLIGHPVVHSDELACASPSARAKAHRKPLSAWTARGLLSRLDAGIALSPLPSRRYAAPAGTPAAYPRGAALLSELAQLPSLLRRFHHLRWFIVLPLKGWAGRPYRTQLGKLPHSLRSCSGSCRGGCAPRSLTPAWGPGRVGASPTAV